MKKTFFWMMVGLILTISSCSTPKVAYFQDVTPGQTNDIANRWDIRLRPGDQIAILVNSNDERLSQLFNLPIVTRQFGVHSYYGNNGMSGYTLDKDGNIDFPVLGSVHLEGMTRQETASFIKDELISNDLIKDPVVTVEFMNLTVSVLGEVNKPGIFNIPKDKITLLDAISIAGDLTIMGNRKNVRVQREENGKNVIYMVNLTSGKELYSSPVYYLQQNDIVYIEPITMRARMATVNGNTLLSSQFWLSLTSVLASVGLLIIQLIPTTK